jgi:hypothetical protein
MKIKPQIDIATGELCSCTFAYPLNDKINLFSVLVPLVPPVSHNLKFTNAPHNTANNKTIFKGQAYLPGLRVELSSLGISVSCIFGVGLSPVSVSINFFSIMRMMLNPSSLPPIRRYESNDGCGVPTDKFRSIEAETNQGNFGCSDRSNATRWR